MAARLAVGVGIKDGKTERQAQVIKENVSLREDVNERYKTKRTSCNTC